MDDHLVDILLPTFNGDKYISDQINSILCQTFTKFRLIIRDDGSSDETKEYLNHFRKVDSRILWLKDDLGNVGLVKSIEILLKYSTAPYIMFADQDDIWMKNKILKFYNSIASHDSSIPLLAYSNSLLLYENSDSLKLNLNHSRHKDGLENCLFNFFVQGASSMINISLKKQVLPFPEVVYVHDRYFHLMAELTGKIIYIPQPTMFYRQHSNNLIGASKKFRNLRFFKISRRSFFNSKDKELVAYLYHFKFPSNLLLKAYLQLVSQDINVFKKLTLIFRYNFTLRFIDILRLIIYK